MSRVGNAAITVPSGVEIAIDGSTITVKGSKGELSRELPGGVTANAVVATLLCGNCHGYLAAFPALRITRSSL